MYLRHMVGCETNESKIPWTDQRDLVVKMTRKKLSERDICTKFINPALEQAGWDM